MPKNHNNNSDPTKWLSCAFVFSGDRRVRHNANYVAYAQMPGCPLCCTVVLGWHNCLVRFTTHKLRFVKSYHHNQIDYVFPKWVALIDIDGVFFKEINNIVANFT